MLATSNKMLTKLDSLPMALDPTCMSELQIPQGNEMNYWYKKNIFVWERTAIHY